MIEFGYVLLLIIKEKYGVESLINFGKCRRQFGEMFEKT